MNKYEAMFVFDPTFGASFENCETEVRRLMDRAEAELLFCRKWEERRLAYRIRGRKRGTYVLTYFNAPSTGAAHIERDVKISEDILRMLILRADHVTPEMMERAASPHSEEKPSDDHKRTDTKAAPPAAPAETVAVETVTADTAPAPAPQDVSESEPPVTD